MHDVSQGKLGQNRSWRPGGGMWISGREGRSDIRVFQVEGDGSIVARA